MKTQSLLTRAGLLAVALCLVSASALRAEGSATPDHKPEKALSAAQKAFDKDGDGKLNDEEKAAWKKAMLEKYDTNKDGKLDDAEKAAMKADMKGDHKKDKHAE